MIIDTHIHLDYDSYQDDFDDVLSRATQAGVVSCIIPGADPKDLKKASLLCKKYKNLFFAAGVHPYHCDDFDRDEILFYAKDENCIAIGECGLDYYRLPEDEILKKQNIQKQKDIFLEQIQIAKDLKLPLIVHIRDSSVDSLDILLKNNAEEVGGVLHCFNADEQLLKLANMNFYYGIGGVLTFKNAKKLINILPKIPKDKLLIETDGPYLTPHPHRGVRNEPAYTKLIAQKMAEILNMSCEDIESLTTINAQKCFDGLKKSEFLI